MPIPIDAASASQVGSLRSVSNASSGSTSALPAVASNASQLVSRFSRGGTPITSTAETATVGSFSQPFRTSSSVRVELNVACESNSFLMQLPRVSARQLDHLPPAFTTASGECMRVGVVHKKLVLSKPLFSS